MVIIFYKLEFSFLWAMSSYKLRLAIAWDVAKETS